MLINSYLPSEKLPSTDLKGIINSLKLIAEATKTSKKNAYQTRSKIGTYIIKEGDKVEVLVYFIHYSTSHEQGWIWNTNKAKLGIYYVRYSIMSEKLILDHKRLAELDKHKMQKWETMVKHSRSDL
jgi:hypothetical protein